MNAQTVDVIIVQSVRKFYQTKMKLRSFEEVWTFTVMLSIGWIILITIEDALKEIERQENCGGYIP